MKIFKKLAILSMALLCTFGLGALTACGGADNSSTTSTDSNTYTCYEFVVLDKDGNKVGEGYNVQLCMVNPDGTLGTCLEPVAVVNGICEYTKVTTTGVYEAHVMEGYSVVEIKEVVKTSADAFGSYTLQLAE